MVTALCVVSSSEIKIPLLTDATLASYHISQRPDFDYGPYFVAWITNPMWNIKNIIENNPTMTKLFIETASQIKSEYWDEIRANDIEKYNYLQNLITSSKENINNHKR